MLARARTPVVVDETLVELDLEGDPLAGPPPLAAFAGDLAICVGSASKTHWGGLRLGWIRASEDLLGRLVSARYAVDLGSPVFEQIVLAELLDDDAALGRRREELRGYRDALAGAVHRHLPDWTFTLPKGGLSLWCRMPEPVSSRLAVAAASHGVQVAPGSRFGVHGGLERWIRLPFSLPPDTDRRGGPPAERRGGVGPRHAGLAGRTDRLTERTGALDASLLPGMGGVHVHPAHRFVVPHSHFAGVTPFAGAAASRHSPSTCREAGGSGVLSDRRVPLGAVSEDSRSTPGVGPGAAGAARRRDRDPTRPGAVGRSERLWFRMGFGPWGTSDAVQASRDVKESRISYWSRGNVTRSRRASTSS